MSEASEVIPGTRRPLDCDRMHRDLADLIVGTLGLDMAPGDIDPQAPLFVDGLGLDSIDALELALAISRTYGFELRSDDERNGRIFASLDTLARHIAAHRTL